jgi:hypothetical protein
MYNCYCNNLKVYKEKVAGVRRTNLRPAKTAWQCSIIAWLKEQSEYYLITPV